ncbi:hypothetical protein [Maribellus mangrovi]|uniref:hypothetical protein n=1 Tax=Maribellus mangrovi TaxID=3133146 RepID=UPI0030EF2829
MLYGKPNLDIQAVENYTYRIDQAQLVNLIDSISPVDAEVYLSGALLGYNHEYKELIVSNPNYQYSYVYNFKSNSWHKISESYKLFINVWPKLYGVRYNTSNGGEFDGVYDFTDEQFDYYINTLTVTRPCKVNDNIDFVLIHRAIQRCVIETTPLCYAGLFVIGSNDQVIDKSLGGVFLKRTIIAVQI